MKGNEFFYTRALYPYCSNNISDFRAGVHKYNLPFLNAAILKKYLSLYAPTTLDVLHALICTGFTDCEEREGSEQFKMKIHVSSRVWTTNLLSRSKLTHHPRPFGYTDRHD